MKVYFFKNLFLTCMWVLFSPHIHFLVDNEKFDITSIFYFSFLYVWALKKLVPIMKKVEVL